MTPAKADIENNLVSQNDVATGIINAIFNGGKVFVEPEDLRDAPLDATYESFGRLRELRRDVAKYWVRANRCECVFAFEIQSAPDQNMPVRVVGYNGASYRDQLKNPTLEKQFGLGDDRVAPVFTTVLYFGAERWNNNRKLSERATMSEDAAKIMRPFFDDFEIRVVDFADMSDEELRKFPPDIYIVAEYFRCKRNGWEYVPSKVKIIHKRELFFFMQYVVGDDRFAYDVVMQGYDKEPEYMCEVLDRIEARGEARGEAIGEAKGRLEEKKIMAKKLRQEGWTVERIAEFIEIPVVDVKIWLSGE